jgi:hypothetical protein
LVSLTIYASVIGEIGIYATSEADKGVIRETGEAAGRAGAAGGV